MDNLYTTTNDDGMNGNGEMEICGGGGGNSLQQHLQQHGAGHKRRRMSSSAAPGLAIQNSEFLKLFIFLVPTNHCH
jgi:hypothetical protein